MNIDVFGLITLLGIALWSGGYVASKYRGWVDGHRFLTRHDDAVNDAAEDLMDRDDDNGGGRIA